MDNDDDVGFVIFRNVYCAETSSVVTTAGEGQQWHESLFVKSSILQAALDAVAKGYFNKGHIPETGTQWMPGTQWMTPTQDTLSSVFRREITPPHLFLFHHRTALKEYAAKHADSSDHVNALLRYADEMYGADFQEAEKLFRRGLVTQRHLLKLFVPNEIVVSGSRGLYAAFVVQKWPVLGAGNSLSLACWSWHTNGSHWVRKTRGLSVQSVDGEARITELLAYPLRFADPEIVSLLELRGAKLWHLRNQSHVQYTGWNISRDQYYVGFFRISFGWTAILIVAKPDSRFMIDHKVYKKMHQYADAFTFDVAEANYLYDRRPSFVTNSYPRSNDVFLLLPPDTYGFYLTEKKWST